MDPVKAFIQLGYKSQSWFDDNATLILKEGQTVYLAEVDTNTPTAPKFKRGDGVNELQDLIFSSDGIGTGVQSVTGDGVGGTPTDVVLTFPTPVQIGAVDLVNAQNIGGVKKFTDNLIVGANLLPDVDLTSNLGSALKRFSEAYSNSFYGASLDAISGSLNIGGVNATTVNIGAAAGNVAVNIGTSGTNVITIGNSNSTVNILGSVLYENVTNLEVKDKLITLNKGGGPSSATGTGIEFEENSLITGYIKTTGGRDGFLFKSPANSADSSFIFTATAPRTYTLPDSTGTLLLNPSFTDGSVIYWNSGFAQSNATLFYDQANTIFYVGGNTNPLSLLNLKAYFQGNVNSYSQINSINTNAGTTASGDIVISADNATDSTKYINMGINSSGNTSVGVLGGALTGYLYVADGRYATGTSTANDVYLFTNSTERFRITSFGQVGFNQSTKLAQVAITQIADFVATGTTNASSTGSITGIGTRFLSEIAIGDQISLSSAPSTFFVVTAISSDTALTVTNSMGNGTSQTINVKKSPFAIISNTGTNYFLVSAAGTIGMGQVPVTSIALAITTTGSVGAVSGNSASATAITGTGATGGSFQGTNTGVIAGTTSSNTLIPALVARKIQNTNSNDRVFEVAKYLSSGTASVGIASMAYFSMANDAGTVPVDFGKFGMVATNVTSSGNLQVADYTWSLVASGSGTMTERMRLTSAGNLLVGTSTEIVGSLGIARFVQGTSNTYIGQHSSGVAGLWLLPTATNPASTNYALAASSAILALHNVTGIVHRIATVDKFTIDATTFSFTPGAATSGANTVYSFTTPASTGQTTGTETIGFDFNMTSTITHAGNTGYASQRDIYIKPRTHASAGAGLVINDGWTVYIGGSPINGSQTTVTRPWGLGVLGDAQFQNNIYVGAAGVAAGAKITIAAGVDTATGAPLKFTSGTLTTGANIVAGLMEYNGTNLFFVRSGTTRENIVCASAVNAVSPTAPNRTITVNINGTTLYIAAKTTND